jgi:hypothetical protein
VVRQPKTITIRLFASSKMAQKKYPNILRFDITPSEVKPLSQQIIEESKKVYFFC